MHEVSTPPIKVWVKKEFQYDLEKGFGEFDRGIIVSARSVCGSGMLFQVLMENGVLRDKLPIHAFVTDKNAPEIPFHHLQLWNCFSANFSIISINYLSGLKVDVKLKNGNWESGTYLWTFQWGPDYSHGIDLTLAADPFEHKSSHFIELDNGCFVLQPNNRLKWRDPSFITKPFPEKPDYKGNSKTWNCEGYDKWVTEDSNAWFYSISENQCKD
jgi:hypothetical protein